MGNSRISGVRKAVAAAVLLSGIAWSGLASAGTLTLTAEGLSRGFSLSTFASGFLTVNCCGPIPYIGPIGAARLANGNIVVRNYGDDTNYVFPDVDGQTPESAIASAYIGGHAATGMAELNGVVYSVDFPNHDIRVVNNDGTLGAAIAIGAASANGLAANSHNNSIYVSAKDNSVYQVDLTNPSSPVVSVFASLRHEVDGVTVSPDGTTVYVTDTAGYIRGYDTITKAQTFTSGEFTNGPDGVGVITGSLLTGQLVMNNNDGTVYLLNPDDKLNWKTIASGGDRGDLVGFDSSNGTLLLTMGAFVYRLGLTGASIGGDDTGTGVPEPATLGLLGLGLAGAIVARRKRQA